jgi:hypothetical protein
LFCASDTKAYKFIKAEKDFEKAERVCFPTLSAGGGKGCKIKESDMHRAFMETRHGEGAGFKWQQGDDLNMHLLYNCGNCLVSKLDTIIPTLPVPQYFYRRVHKAKDTLCTKNEITLFCLKQTWQAQFFTKCAAYQEGKECFSHLSPHATICQVQGRKLDKALMTFDHDVDTMNVERAHLYESEKQRLVDECEMCVGRIVPNYNSGAEIKETHQCEKQLRSSCPKMALRGPICTSCAKKNALQINQGLEQSCSAYQIEHFCYDMVGSESVRGAGLEELQPELSPAESQLVRSLVHEDVKSSVQKGNVGTRTYTDPCEVKLHKFCPELALNGPRCTSCVKKNIQQISQELEQKCTAYQIEHFCYDMGGSKTGLDAGTLGKIGECETKLIDYCPTHQGALGETEGLECEQCVKEHMAEINTVLRADQKCTDYHYENYCYAAGDSEVKKTFEGKWPGGKAYLRKRHPREDKINNQEKLLLMGADADLAVENMQVKEAVKQSEERREKHLKKDEKMAKTAHVSIMYLSCIAVVAILVYGVNVYHTQIQRIIPQQNSREESESDLDNEGLLQAEQAGRSSRNLEINTSPVSGAGSPDSPVGMTNRRRSSTSGSKLSI